MTETNLSQAMRPHGVLGRIFAALMERLNEGSYRWAIDALKDTPPKSLYEIGFGTGRFLELAASKLKVRRLRGVDPAELMVGMAANRLRKFAKACEIEVRTGDDAATYWPTETFEAVAAIHSFQFWSDPANTLARLRTQLAPHGKLVLILRNHGRNPPAWLPNPISRSGNEVVGTRAALAAAQFALVIDQPIDTASHGLVARPE